MTLSGPGRQTPQPCKLVLGEVGGIPYPVLQRGGAEDRPWQGHDTGTRLCHDAAELVRACCVIDDVGGAHLERTGSPRFREGFEDRDDLDSIAAGSTSRAPTERSLGLDPMPLS